MSLRTGTRKIGEHTYSAVQMIPTVAMVVGLKLTKIIAPCIDRIKEIAPEIATLQKEGADPMEVGLKALPAIKDILVEMEPEKTMELVIELVKNATKNGSSIVNVDSEFMENPADMFQVAWFVAEINFKGFFSGLLNSVKVTQEGTELQ
jgi:hypothetical protein